MLLGFDIYVSIFIMLYVLKHKTKSGTSENAYIKGKLNVNYLKIGLL